MSPLTSRLPLRARWVIVLLAVGVLVGGIAGEAARVALRRVRQARTATAPRVASTALNVLSITPHSGLIGPKPRDGGALEPYGEGLLLATGEGTFFRLDANPDGNGLTAVRLSLASPHEEGQFQQIQQNPKDATRLRLTDMLLSAEPTGQVYVAHQYWNAQDKCFTLRVSAATLEEGIAAGLEAGDSWRTVFETSPCLPPPLPFDDTETGGRLAWFGGELLLTVGDHGFSGVHGALQLAQSGDNDYGKVLAIDPVSGEHRIVTKGHRNPQGLLVDAEGRIWTSEHGPQGGDEVNLLREGGNYGWPLATYGADYGRTYWPLAPSDHDHGAFIEPVQAFVPSIAASNLIRVESPLFPEWKGDILLAALRHSLYRLRLKHEQVVYVEPIFIGGNVRIRDLTERADGRIFLWTDAGAVFEIAPGSAARAGAAVFDRCRTCHETTPGAETSAPSLRGIVGRRAGAAPGYDYSQALANLDAAWTAEQLDAFLADPDQAVPGSAMQQGRVADPDERRALIEFLKTYR